MQETPTGIPAGVSFSLSVFYPLTNKIKAFTQNKKHKLNSDYEVS